MPSITYLLRQKRELDMCTTKTSKPGLIDIFRAYWVAASIESEGILMSVLPHLGTITIC